MSKPVLNIVPNIEEDWTIFKIYENTSFGDWNPIFKEAKDELKLVSLVMEKEKHERQQYLFPMMKDIFSCFLRTPLKSIRVVILNDKPYNSYFSNGLALSVNEKDTMTFALENIYKNLKKSYPYREIEYDGRLKGWINQGVFLLNASLTTNEEERSNIYVDIWRGFIRKIIRSITEYNKDIPFILMGRDAQSYEEFIGNAIHIVNSPTPFSSKYFPKSKPFLEINEYLKKTNKKEILWYDM